MKTKLARETTEIRKHNRNEWVSRLALLREKVLETEDEESADKLFQLITKLQENEYAIGFCGHFSAGKSSMINTLWEENLLPSSPIPTSANLVKVKAGEPWVRVYFKESEPLQFSYPYDLHVVQAYCADGDEVASVVISHPNSDFPKEVAILDTPGIDSTDDAHRIATTSSLHLADTVFYVMDYNHVQSELNFHFAKQIKELGKKLYFVINQIDKHNREELDFESFKVGVRDAFHNWDIQPDGIFFTSLAEKDHPHNELEQLKQCIQLLIKNREHEFNQNIESAATAIINEHADWLAAQYEDQMRTLEEQFAQISNDKLEQLQADYAILLREKDANEQSIANFSEQLQTEVNKILNSAILMPFETRELARQYLEANDEQFKVGFLFSKKKTEQEKNARLQAFYNQFSETVASQLDWHIKQLLVNTAKQYGLEDNQFFLDILNASVQIPQTILRELIKPGAKVNGESILNYTDDVAHYAKRTYRAFAQDKIQQLVTMYKEKMERVNRQLEEQSVTMKQQLDAHKALENLQTDLENNKGMLFKLIDDRSFSQAAEEARARLPKKKEFTIVTSQEMHEKASSSEQQVEQADIRNNVSESTPVHVEPSSSIETVVKQLKTIAEEVKGVHGFQSFAQDMEERAQRLTNRDYTIALFGAFSAGKSSFANAMIGASVLPVSPNPTTATINKIVPVDEDHPHGTVIVKMKSMEQLMSDIQNSLTFFDRKIETIDQVQSVIQVLNPSELRPQAKPHYAFLKAVEKGLANYLQRPGEEVVVDLPQFNEYVVDEDKACFVEWIELYYDCPLTEQGITLVDTPGADSINARHTGVAFEYIKNADAVLFVTYYNHAFSQADREFLIQLGRVKDLFELDKMFFIVNAADLAKSKEEITSVVHHVKDNLVQYGIRQPRIYALSSQMALLAKMEKSGTMSSLQHERLLALVTKNRKTPITSLAETGIIRSGIQPFEEAFYQFIRTELPNTAIQAAKTEMHRVSQTLSEWIASAKEGEDVRATKQQQAVKLRSEIISRVQKVSTSVEEKAIRQEIEELLYYVNQRLFLRYNEAFQEAFNPAVLHQGQQSIRETLTACLHELVEFIGFDLAQEMRATSLRVETFMSKLLETKYKQITEEILEQSQAVLIQEYEKGVYPSPSIHESFDTVDITILQRSLTLFKSQKHFFEQGGSREMRAAIEKELRDPVEQYTKLNQVIFSEYYVELFQSEVKRIQERLTKQVNEYFEGAISALSADVDLNELTSIYERIKKNLA